MTGHVTPLPSVVVGLGRIGAGYDLTGGELSDPAQTVRTHALALHSHPSFRLVAGVDPDTGMRQRFTTAYDCPSYPSVESVPESLGAAVWVLACPARLHLEVFRSVIRRRPRAVLIEKPFAANSREAAEIVRLAREAGCLLAVNYVRRFEPGLNRLRAELRSGALGDPVKGVGWYTKGWVNNASHLVDLLRYLLGEAAGMRLLDPGPAGLSDPEPDVLASFGGVPMYLLAGREAAYSRLDVELVTGGSLITISGSGTGIHVHSATGAPGDARILSAPRAIPTGMRRYQWHVADALSEALLSDQPLASSGDSALGTSRTIDEILNQLEAAR